MESLTPHQISQMLKRIASDSDVAIDAVKLRHQLNSIVGALNMTRKTRISRIASELHQLAQEEASLSTLISSDISHSYDNPEIDYSERIASAIDNLKSEIEEFLSDLLKG